MNFDLLIATLLIAGGGFAFIAGLGVLRLPDVLVRMHASTKAGTLGSGLILLSIALVFDDTLVTTKAILIVVFLLLTAPVAAHLIGRAAYRSATPLWEKTRVNEARAFAENDMGAPASLGTHANRPPQSEEATHD